MIKVYLFIFCIVLTFNVFSQEKDSTYQEITLNNGMVFNGTIIKHVKDSLLFRDFNSDSIEISKSDIKDIQLKYFSQIKKIEYPNQPDIQKNYNSATPTDPRQSEGFLMPTGINQKGGSLHIGNYEVFLLNASLGITDWFSINGGYSPYSFTSNDPTYTLGFKIGTSEFYNKFAFSVGSQFIKLSKKRDWSPLFFGSASYGNANTKLNFCFCTFTSGTKSNILGSIGLDALTSDVSKIICELWFVPEIQFIPFIIETRFFGKHFVGEIGMLFTIPTGKVPFVTFPVAKIFYNF